MVLILVSILLYYIYYLILYPNLLNKYNLGYQLEIICDEEEVTISMNYPKYISEFVERKLIVNVQNNNSTPKDLSISFVASSYSGKGVEESKKDESSEVDISSVRSIISYTNPDTTSYFPNHINFHLLPYGIVKGVFYLNVGTFKEDDIVTLYMYKDGVVISEGVVIISDVKEGEESNLGTITLNKVETLRHTLIETILLPPWSNGILIAVGIFISKASESLIGDSAKKERRHKKMLKGIKNKTLRKILMHIWMIICIFLFSSGSMLLIFGIIIKIAGLGDRFVTNNNPLVKPEAIWWGIFLIIMAILFWNLDFFCRKYRIRYIPGTWKRPTTLNTTKKEDYEVVEEEGKDL